MVKIRGGLRGHVGVVFLALFGSQLVLAITGPLVVRTIGVEARGEVAAAYSLILTASFIGMFGLPTAVSVFIARDQLNARALLRRFGWLYAGISVVPLGLVTLIAATGWLVGDALPGGRLLLPGLAFGVLVFMWWSMFSEALAGEHRFNQYAITRAVPSVLMLFIVLGLLVTGTRPTSLAMLSCYVLTSAAAAVLSFVALAPRRAAVSPPAVTPESTVNGSDLVRFGAKSSVESAAPIDGMQIDQLMIAAILTSHALGLYVIGYAFETLPVLMIGVVAIVAGPKLVATADPLERLHKVRKWFLLAVAGGIASCVGVIIVLRPVLIFAFGHEAEDAIPIARVLVIAGFGLGMRRVGFVIARAYARPELATFAELVGGAVMLLLAVPFMHAWGVIGAAWALFAAGVACCVVQAVTLLPVIARSVRPEYLARSGPSPSVDHVH